MEIDISKIIETGREFLKPKWHLWKRIKNDQANGIQIPILEKEYNQDSILIDLVPISNITCGKEEFITVVKNRKSRRKLIIAAHKMIAIDAGHVCQNLYLAAESIQCGCCAIGAYAQEKMDEFLQVDGEEEFTFYMATVGK
ncbi:nitroreductase family protein [Clostridium sp. C2-6-12]|uniref:nitroreductase family protein n=1 Tax=Clostridium sp. C2-6-12 TaxID=2698832 RepID=UPI0013704829|nr:nitroreductase family protein [Clostridium sp. C2-6-12]